MAEQPAIDKKLARELLIKSKVYRTFAKMFALVGLGIFLGVYMQYYEADVAKALHDPFIIVFIVFPFMPAVICSRRALKADAELKKLLAVEKPTAQ